MVESNAEPWRPIVELKEFVSFSLTQIVDGVVEAQKQAETNGAAINPRVTDQSAAVHRPGRLRPDIGGAPVKDIQFDVAVTITESEKTDAKAGISIFSAKLVGELGGDSATESASRLRFSVPLALPTVD